MSWRAFWAALTLFPRRRAPTPVVDAALREMFRVKHKLPWRFRIEPDFGGHYWRVVRIDDGAVLMAGLSDYADAYHWARDRGGLHVMTDEQTLTLLKMLDDAGGNEP